jgi:hypothetical protein
VFWLWVSGEVWRIQVVLPGNSDQGKERVSPHVGEGCAHAVGSGRFSNRAENTLAETFVDNVDRLGFDNWTQHEALYPNGKHVNEFRIRVQSRIVRCW